MNKEAFVVLTFLGIIAAEAMYIYVFRDKYRDYRNQDYLMRSLLQIAPVTIVIFVIGLLLIAWLR